MRIQNPDEHLRWSFLRKAVNYFRKKPHPNFWQGSEYDIIMVIVKNSVTSFLFFLLSCFFRNTWISAGFIIQSKWNIRFW